MYSAYIHKQLFNKEIYSSLLVSRKQDNTYVYVNTRQ